MRATALRICDGLRTRATAPSRSSAATRAQLDLRDYLPPAPHAAVPLEPQAEFLLVTRAGRLARIGGRHVLRLAHNPATEALYASIDERLTA